ncbi:MAG: hypothetical protein LLG97_06915 [Deltaproteobacteria bacterium]|nr:hypothetical protein [Deltaproteobacteria bacterium]
MGMLRITAWGSFETTAETFCAMESGHAVAVDDAIRFLQEKMLPWAKEQDRFLRAREQTPTDHFAEADRRGLLVPELTLSQWENADKYLREVEDAYRGIPTGAFGLTTIVPLRMRFDSGVRTRALYNEIMAIR